MIKPAYFSLRMNEPSNNPPPAGLTNTEIEELRIRFGKNNFRNGSSRNLPHTVWDIITEPMFLMLWLACALYFLLGEASEGVMMLVAMVLVGAISAYQEIKSSRALEALKQYTAPRTMVIRNGKEQVIMSEDLLPGDIMVLTEGNLIPADGELVRANDLSVNEAVITGESLPADKNTTAGNNLLFQGTTINAGKCYARVTATGNNTVLGKLGKSLGTISSSKTLLQRQVSRFVNRMALFGVSAFVLVWLINYLHSGNILQSLLLGLTLAMSALPEEIPVAFSSFMALGAYHMSRIGIITRQPQTIENLGAVSVICLDKTGTITQNRMRLLKIYDFKKDATENIQHGDPVQSTTVLHYARLACEPEPFDSTEKAIVEAWAHNRSAINIEQLRMVHEYPLEGNPPMMTHAWQNGNSIIIAGKGAPERIMSSCRLEGAARQKVQEITAAMAASGHRVLGVCSATNNGYGYPGKQDDFNWTFEGLVALFDPPRENVPAVFNSWYGAGIHIKLLTGDYAGTAFNIARQVQMRTGSDYLLGEQVMALDQATLSEKVKQVHIYARMFPEAKLKVVEALKANGDIVAMTGDGVNDGPALKSAHIGIAMGSGGTEIAREAADLVITDDDLGKITAAISRGRKIYTNLKKAVRYIISIHIPIILTASLPLLLGWKLPNIFTPVHIIFLELVMGPTCSIFYEREAVEENSMQRPPRSRITGLFRGKEMMMSISQGLIITLGMLLLYYFYMQHNYPDSYVRTMVFTTLIYSNIFLTFINRSFTQPSWKTFRHKNNLVPAVLGASLAFLAVIYFVPGVKQLFLLTSINKTDYLLCIAVSLACTAWIDLYKVFLSRRSG